MLQYLVNDLLDLFQIKKGKFKKNEAPADIRKEIGTVIEMMRIPCQKKNIDLELIINDSVPDFLLVDV